jgi:hypothetical protein
MSAAFLNGGQSLSACFSLWFNSACFVLYSWVSIKGLVYVWFPCSVILLCGKMSKLSTNFLWNNGNVHGVLYNGTYIILYYIILYYILG